MSRERGWRPSHNDTHGVEWYDTGEVGFRLVLDPSLDRTYREAVMSTEIEMLRERIRSSDSDTGAALLPTLLLGLILTSLLALAFLAGDQRRCDHLRADGSPLVERYCGTEAGR
jgi:hypothetical protein